MSAAITITADTDDDPYSASWADVPDSDIAAVERHFTSSPGWSLSNDPTDLRVSTLFAYIEVGGQPPRLYLATDAAVVDHAAKTVQEILRRGPDTVS